ncbi:MAG: glycoside hydrolase family 25 [Bacilli bacterium]|nr:glycoside hydrolase family 25 [Bacilli bacterium]
MKKILAILLCTVLLTGCSIDLETKMYDGMDSTKLPDGAYINIKKDISVFSSPKLIDVIDTNVEDIDANLELDTETIGKNTIVVSYSYKNKQYKYALNYNVLDNIAPIYLSAPSSKYVLVNDDTNPCDSINIADNYTKVPTCEVVGNYDITKVGTYNVKFVIKDEADNKNERKLTINVVNKIPSSPSNPSPSTPNPGVKFSWVINTFKTDKTEIGLDVSRWQGDIDFEKVKNAGATFVMMRMGVSNKPEEELAMDRKYKQNIKNAKAAGLKVGVYIYTTAINDEMAKTLADFAINTLDGETLDFPIVFDWENWSKFRTYGISIHDLNKTFLTFANELEKRGYQTMLYGSKHYLEIMWEDSIKEKYPVWLAHYTNSQTSYEGKYMMWQQCSDGHIDGIDGEVDIDILYN